MTVSKPARFRVLGANAGATVLGAGLGLRHTARSRR